MYIVLLYNLFGIFIISTGTYTTLTLQTNLTTNNEYNNFLLNIFCGLTLFLTIILSSFGFCMGYIAYKGRKK